MLLLASRVITEAMMQAPGDPSMVERDQGDRTGGLGGTSQRGNSNAPLLWPRASPVLDLAKVSFATELTHG